jgi:hypothetical protein
MRVCMLLRRVVFRLQTLRYRPISGFMTMEQFIYKQFLQMMPRRWLHGLVRVRSIPRPGLIQLMARG